MTHAELVQVAASFLRTAQRCSVLVTEPGALTYEIPDAMGWSSRGSVVVECKTSRADFLRDRKKATQREGSPFAARLLGDFRYYLAPPELLSPADLVPGVGLLERHGRRTVVVVAAKRRERTAERMAAEVEILRLQLARFDESRRFGLVMAAARRLHRGELITLKRLVDARLERPGERLPAGDVLALVATENTH